jgi:hypothetical protein
MATNHPGGDDGPSLVPDTSAYLHQLRERRHAKEKDLKCVITQRDSETGGGKSTAAVWLALCWDKHGWDGEKKGMTDPQRFLNTLPDLPRHSVLILDEAEELDARRAMKDENIRFSKKWMKMRTRQVDSILTLPTTSALDVRMKELADVRIHVTERGKARVYRIKVNDTTGDVKEQYIEHWSWPDVSDHEEFRALDKAKQKDLDKGANERSGEREQNTAALKRAIRREAKRRRQDGETYEDIAENIPDNPETDAPYAEATVYRWTKGVETDA